MTMPNYEPIEIEFDCPVCGDTVILKTTEKNNITPIEGFRERHALTEDSVENDNRCNVSFNSCAKSILDRYDFISHNLPMVYTNIHEREKDKEVLRKALEGIRNQGLGVSLSYIYNSREPKYDSVYGWRFGNGYFAVTGNRNMPYNIHSSKSLYGMYDFFERYLTRDPDSIDSY